MTNGHTLEIEHGADECSGYGSLVGQVQAALDAAGVAHTSHGNHPIQAIMPYRERPAPRLRPWTTAGGSSWRWVNDDDGSDAKFGTKIKAWVNCHPILDWPEDADIPQRSDRDAVRLSIGLPAGCDFDGADKRVLLTMWESSELPRLVRPWAPHLRRSHLVVVPAAHSANVVHAAVPDVPTAVIPLVTDPERWPLQDRSSRVGSRRPFVFVLAGDLSIRKGFVEAYSAFWRAFGDRLDVGLILKTRGGSDMLHLDYNDEPLARERWTWHLQFTDRNVRVLRGDWTRAAMNRLYGAADAFLWPSRGEGWGYPPREGAATGLLPLSPAHTGMDDAEEWAVPIPYREWAEPALFRHWGGQCGYNHVVDVDALAQLMTQVVEERRETVYEMGREASRAVTRRTLAEMGEELAASIEGRFNLRLRRN